MYKTNRAAIIYILQKRHKNEYKLFFIKIQFLINFRDFQTMRTFKIPGSLLLQNASQERSERASLLVAVYS